MNPTHDQEVVYAKGCTNIEQLNQLISNRSNDNFKMAFFYNPPNDHQIYHITCEFLNEINNYELPSDHTFYYKLDDKNLYKITCILISHSLIVQFLNKKMYEIEGDEQQQDFLTFSNYQRNNLESNLKDYWRLYDASPLSSNSSYGDNTQTISLTDYQTNFYNGFSQQTRVGYFTNNVINPQQIPEGLRYNGNTTSFCGNTIGNNVMVTQEVSITSSQINGFLQPINPLSTSAAQATHNSVTNSQQRINFNNNIPQHITDRENYYGNINSFHGTIINNTPVTQSALTTDINQTYGNDFQDVNGARNFAYIWQQVDLNNNYYRETENIGNNVMTLQTNGLTCDHQDANDIHQVTQSQQQVDLNNNYGNTDLHNGNIGHSAMTTQTNNGIFTKLLDCSNMVYSHHIQHPQSMKPFRYGCF